MLLHLSFRFLFCLGIDRLELHRCAVLALALIRGFHERKNLDRLLRADRWLARLEELRNLDNQRLIPLKSRCLIDLLASKDHRAVIVLSFAQALESSNATVLPDAGDDVGAFRMCARDRS